MLGRPSGIVNMTEGVTGEDRVGLGNNLTELNNKHLVILLIQIIFPAIQASH